jgi:hypothetical protein
MSDDKHKRLRELADNATQGPWCADMACVHRRTAEDSFTHENCIARCTLTPTPGWNANAEYIAAANPECIRELLDERDELITKLRDARLRAGDFDIECPCCGGVAASGMCQDGQALACKCGGLISLDTETEPWANVFEECPPEALCQPGNDPFSQHVTKIEDERDELRMQNKSLVASIGEYRGTNANLVEGYQMWKAAVDSIGTLEDLLDDWAASGIDKSDYVYCARKLEEES